MRGEVGVRYLSSVRGQVIAITGKCFLIQADLVERIKSQGGDVTPKLRPTRATTVLIRGASERWAFEGHGQKEDRARDLIRDGFDIRIVYDTEFQKLLEKGEPARCAEYVAGELIDWLRPTSKGEYEHSTLTEGSLDRKQTVLGRREQSFLRTHLFASKLSSTCSLCGVTTPVELMVAAHIKPRSDCDLTERRDAPNIVFPLCTLGCDAFYERGFVSVSGDGLIVTVDTAGIPTEVGQRIKAFAGRTCTAWRKETKRYFDWHCKYRFKGLPKT